MCCLGFVGYLVCLCFRVLLCRALRCLLKTWVVAIYLVLCAWVASCVLVVIVVVARCFCLGLLFCMVDCGCLSLERLCCL